MERAAVVRRVKPDQEDAYGAWLEASAEQLDDLHRRYGIRAKTVLTAGRRFIEHYEADQTEAVLSLLSDPDWVSMRDDQLADVLDESEATPAVHEEIFAWSVASSGSVERAGLVLTIRPGEEAAYREWLESGVLEELERIWNRNEIYRHDVLAAGTSLVAYYECKSRFNVLKAFREPEALAMLIEQLSAILELDPHTPLSLFQEVYAWRSAREHEPA